MATQTTIDATTDANVSSNRFGGTAIAAGLLGGALATALILGAFAVTATDPGTVTDAHPGALTDPALMLHRVEEVGGSTSGGSTSGTDDALREQRRGEFGGD